ncbi:MAG: bifunctional pyr operon transcriptional regulator/uracil phosphoribosyltransferase PyrR [Candidatus Omnitrophica bacterium]|nr:bifunctional pyr operon transcriptional regulator/uracil phosphoribosyltransferase PyrR [Candidatus Omnitrophota bacterium]
MSDKVIFDEDGLLRTLKRLAHEIMERNAKLEEISLLGIRTGGAHLARRLQSLIEEISQVKVPLGILDITLYRDDLGGAASQPEVRGTEIDFDINSKIVVLIDDVLFTGRTIRSAIDQVIDFGRPKSIQLAVLVDRGHRELPIRPDFVGKNVPTAREEQVKVELKEEGGKDKVVVRPRANA